MPILDLPDVLAEIRGLSEQLGRPPTQREWMTAFARCNKSLKRFGGFARVRELAMRAGNDGDGITIPDLVPRLRPVEQLIEEKSEKFRQLEAWFQDRRLIPLQVKLGGPIGILHFGDPHIDDDGTDINRLREHIDVVRTTPGMFAANVGDTTNNWCGRAALAKLYGEQSASQLEAWQLAEWFVNSLRGKWLYMIAGNHDMWSGDSDPLKWIAQQANTIHEKSGVRIELQFPNGRKIRVNARHDFPGKSQYNSVHGAMKAGLFGWRDHLLTCGHKHTSGQGVIKCPMTGLVSHAVQVATYKRIDAFASEKGLPDQNISPGVVTLIDPEAEREEELIRVDWSPRQAAEFLTWLRKRRLT